MFFNDICNDILSINLIVVTKYSHDMWFCPSYTTNYLIVLHQCRAMYALVRFTNKIYITITKQIEDHLDLLSIFRINCFFPQLEKICAYVSTNNTEN